MSEVFRGWRRKTGCITLLMACIFMGQWIRIRFALDQLAPVIQMQELEVRTQFLELHLFWSRFTLLSGFLLTLIAAWLLLSKPPQIDLDKNH